MKDYVTPLETYAPLDIPQLQDRADDLIHNPVKIEYGRYYSEALEIFKAHAGQYILFSLVLFAAFSVAGMIPFAGIFLIPMTVGGVIVADKIVRGESYEFSDFFSGYQKFGNLLGAGLLSGLLIVVGTLFCLLPGIYLAVAYSWVLMIVYFQDGAIWETMEASRKIITKQWFEFFIFMLLGNLIVFAGLLLCGVGILAAAPIVWIAQYLLYRDVFLRADGDDYDDLMEVTVDPVDPVDPDEDLV